ncbi:DUF4382 domain-containing protein [Ramlibacter sp. AN1015]|uniref:DUF4382 domain-containing protein n=1 Tax=Ramlibacter sp. AN1015 TaxID=3133428 RepID=UPI0030C626EE
MHNRISLAAGRLHRVAVLAVLAAATLAACGGGSAPAVEPGTLRLALTDAPACGFDHVWVTIAGVRVHASGTALDAEAGWRELPVDPPRRIDLLTLTNGGLQELGGLELPAGRYEQMRLVFAPTGEAGAPVAPHAVQPSGGAMALPLEVPSSQLVVNVPLAVDVAARQTSDLVLDFDACKSVVTAGASGRFQLRPVVQALPRGAGGVQGTVAAELARPGTTVAAQQDGVTVRSTQPDASGKFAIPFLPPGSYTVVVSSLDRATGVVTDVPVESGLTTVNTLPIALPASAMAELTGSLSLNLEADAVNAASTSPLADAEVRALQSLAGGLAVEVRSRAVDGVLGSYRLLVPRSAAQRAAYSPSGTLAFVPDATEQGQYSLDVHLRGGAPLE